VLEGLGQGAAEVVVVVVLAACREEQLLLVAAVKRVALFPVVRRVVLMLVRIQEVPGSVVHRCPAGKGQ